MSDNQLKLFNLATPAKPSSDTFKRVQRATHFHQAFTDNDFKEPLQRPFSEPCKGGAWASKDECLTHEGARINPRTNVCESVSGEEGF